MSLITNTAYNTNNLYYTPNKKLTELTPSSSDANPPKEAKPQDPPRDRVTLSKDVATARIKEAMGLNPTGRLKRGDIEATAQSQEKKVESRLKSLIENLGVDKNQKISLSLDAKFNITIKEKFPQKKQMEKALNEDKELPLTFKGLSANSEIMNFTKDLQTRKTSLVDFMNSDSDSDWNNLLSLASEYSQIKSSDNSLETLLGISKKETPYTFVHEPDKKVG
ncbi:MAG: hypothetical protein HUK40_19640 [Desulfobacter sp.]|nr:hypothetical protein [Desulfobacter sp.]